MREFGGLDQRLDVLACTRTVDMGSEPGKLDVDGYRTLRLSAQG
ncbi:hypothetical protein [Streptomyces sp. NPDC047042]